MRLEIHNEYSDHKIAESYVPDEARATHILAAQSALVQVALSKGHEPMDCGFRKFISGVEYRCRVTEGDITND